MSRIELYFLLDNRGCWGEKGPDPIRRGRDYVLSVELNNFRINLVPF